ncbi:nucleoside diphosphate-linked moiety X motif 13 [Folsomia candida]|uniref:nucleoside diphosphate-linked moiety X motif 13 n=1 Tax=Folsomia candida TaxID=158441 RepID=UPI000B903B27|nr:nucleoside diphosphate-linked moiety X motif 13 [Folsomia candida]
MQSYLQLHTQVSTVILERVAGNQMGWPLLRMARYVKQSKYLQQLKENEEVWSKSFPMASFMMFSKDRAFITSASNPTNPFQAKINWRSYEEIQSYCPDVKGSSVVLGVDAECEEKALFVCPVQPETIDEIQEKFEGKFADMRMAIFSLSTSEAQLVGRGYTMITWNEASKFCQRCGSAMKKTFSGCVRECSEGCTKNHVYPPISPVAITRVLDQTREKVLLVRQPQYPKGMYSCIAGFMEPGETLQDCVRREIAEEAGIVVEEINYFQSQTWPLPQSSLMLGITAIAMEGSEVLDIDKGELEDAKWCTKSEVKEAYERVKKNPGIFRGNDEGLLVIPPRGAIAHQLLRNWIEGDYIPSQL